MKMQARHYEQMKNAVDKVLLDRPDAVSDYEQGLFARSEKVKDLQKRFCFDMLYISGFMRQNSRELYDYLNDDHIYTALKRIIPKVVRRY